MGGEASHLRRRRLVLTLFIAVVAASWLPAVAANRYSDGPGGAHVPLVRPDQGWRFLLDSARLSRGAVLGTDGDALGCARKVWSGSSALAEDVELVYGDGRPFAVPVPPAGGRPAPGKDLVRPRSRLGWVVTGRVRGGPPQMVGLLDYADGRVSWDMRPRRGGACR